MKPTFQTESNLTPRFLLSFSFSPMGFNLLHVFSLFCVVLVGTHAVTPEVYWKSVLPNTPMPKAVTDLLYTSEWNDEKNTAVGVGKGGVSVHTSKPGKRTDVGVHKGGVSVDTKKPGKGTSVGVGKGGVGVHTGKPGKRTDVGVGKGGVAVHTGHKGKPVYVGVHPGSNPFNYKYAASDDQLTDNPNVALFFLEGDLHQGKEMNLHFTKNDQKKATFLPKNVADSIPFSSNKLSQIYNDFSVKPDSLEAETMKQTLDECETKPIEGEEKHCATSLESMVDFTTTKLGKKVKAISTEVNAKKSPLQKYKIKIAKKLAAKKAVVCHKQKYPYPVFYCHKTVSTEEYSVSLVGADGVQVKAVAVCHTDTAKWNPKHLAFQVLKVKPGSVPICHFLPEDHVVWVPY